MRLFFRLVTSVFFIGLAFYSFYLLGRRRGAKNQRDNSRDGYRKKKVVESSIIADDSI